MTVFSRLRREVAEIPASCLPWISLRERLLVGAGEFLLPGVTSALPSTQLATLSPSCYPLPLFQTCAKQRAELRECLHQASGPSPQPGQGSGDFRDL